MDIQQSIISMDVSTWISSMVEELIKNARFDHSDFMGNDQSVVSVDDIVFSMLFYAFKIGRGAGDNKWDEDCYYDFIKREKTFDKLLKKTENFCTKVGSRKISKVKKEIRMRVESREMLNKDPIESIGALVEVPDMEAIVYSKTPRDFIKALHLLGDFPENDPRYYVHVIYRYHMNEFHNSLSENNKVMRFPSIQKWMDIFYPVSSAMNLPPEFREFMKRTGGSKMPVVSLPVPSKTVQNTVVYGYDFESLPWVNFMRQEIFGKFSEWKKSTSKAFLEIYPDHLIMGDPRNMVISNALAQSMDMKNLKTVHDSLILKNVNLKIFFDIIPLFPDVANISREYENKIFISSGEQLRERRGFFVHSLVRGVFQGIAKKRDREEFCNDIYSSLSLPCDTVDEFYEYCSSKKLRKFTDADNELWRSFLSSLERICLVFHVCSRVQEIEEFYSRYGTPDAFVKKMFSRDV